MTKTVVFFANIGRGQKSAEAQNKLNAIGGCGETRSFAFIHLLSTFFKCFPCLRKRCPFHLDLLHRRLLLYVLQKKSSTIAAASQASSSSCVVVVNVVVSTHVTSLSPHFSPNPLPASPLLARSHAHTHTHTHTHTRGYSRKSQPASHQASQPAAITAPPLSSSISCRSRRRTCTVASRRPLRS